MTTSPDPLYAGYRYPAELIGYAVWLYFRFPLSLRMVEEMLAARGISVTYETIRQWGLKFGREFANRIRRRAPRRGDKWHLDGRWCMNTGGVASPPQLRALFDTGGDRHAEAGHSVKRV